MAPLAKGCHVASISEILSSWTPLKNYHSLTTRHMSHHAPKNRSLLFTMIQGHAILLHEYRLVVRSTVFNIIMKRSTNLYLSITLLVSRNVATECFSHSCTKNSIIATGSFVETTRLSMSEWSDFQALEDDDDLYNDKEDLPPAGKLTDLGYGDENDPQSYKAEVGSNIPAPMVDWEGEPLFLPEGSVLELSEENVQAVLAACRMEIGTMFGYQAENRGVGITGGVDFVDLDGPTVVLKLHGRFWHQRPTVLDRVGKYIQGRIPEVIDVVVEDPWELTDEANDNAY